MFAVLQVFAAAPEQKLYEYGVLGVIVVALAWLAYKMFNILLKDRDKAISDRDAMIQDVFTKVLPAIARNTEVLEARQEIDRDMVDVIRQSNGQLSAHTKAFEEFNYALRHGQGGHRSGGG